ncbi:transport between ER and Golgi ATPase protein [Chytriomyces hyalinus]|nr:transport between ER and Golgi ATPase protein [Chytriomyces hyalinus]
MVGFSENAKMATIAKVFEDAYKSPMSVIVIDCIERLLDWVPIGPRFSNAVLQTLLVLLKKQPPKGHRLLILATTTHRDVLQQMDLQEAFNSDIYVPSIQNIRAIETVVSVSAYVPSTTVLYLKECLFQGINLFNDTERYSAMKYLRDAWGDSQPSIGVKKLLMIAEMARQDYDKVDKFVATLLDEGSIPAK